MEFAAQVVLITFTGAVAWMATGLHCIPLWVALHFGLITVERKITRRLRNSESPFALPAVLAAHLAIGAVFAAMPVYLWMQEDEAFHFTGTVLLLGSILNIFLVRAQIWYLALCFVAPDAVAIALIAGHIARQTPTPAQAITVWVVASAIIVYLGVALLQAARAHRRHLVTREQLVQSQKMEALGNLAGGMAHDFNNILNVITGTLDLARDERDPARIAAQLDRAHAAADRGASLIRQVLSFARKSHLEPRRVDPPAVIAEVETMARRLIPERIAIDTLVDPDVPAVRVDEGTLVTALLNLVLNARDAIEGRGRIILSCTLAPGLPSGRRGRVMFSVRDDGHGIAREMIGRVTEPFFTTKPVGEGTGLGLSMVAGFAAQSGGALQIDSQEGAGTEVRMLLPLDDGPAQPKPPAPANRPAPAPIAKPRCVLLVEDQRELLELLQIFLRRSGHVVHAASSGDAALALIEDGVCPDILISDVVMPGQMQGRDLAALVRERFPQAQIVLMSGFEEASFGCPEQKHCDMLFLAKPVRLAELAEAIAPR
ncbi:ATP-binding protein [Rhodobacter viridis]|nr:ATP-binding protein [Rhodobacter viridis]